MTLSLLEAFNQTGSVVSGMPQRSQGEVTGIVNGYKCRCQRLVRGARVHQKEAVRSARCTLDQEIECDSP